MPTTVLARGTDLSWESQRVGVARVVLGTTGARALRFWLDDGRLRVAMEVATGRPVDVTVQPGLAVRLVDEAARWSGTDPAPVRARVARCVQDLLAEAGAAHADHLTGLSLEAVLLAASYPLTVPAMAEGVAPIRDVPRWAVPVLSQSNARAALAEHVGPAGTNRRGARNLVASLTPPDSAMPTPTLALYPLALVAMGAHVLDADRVANTLELTEPYRPEAEWPSTDDVELARTVLTAFGPARAARLLADAATLERGPERLIATLRSLRQVRSELPSRLPRGLAEVEALCQELLPLDPRAAEPAALEPAPDAHGLADDAALMLVQAAFGEGAVPVHDHRLRVARPPDGRAPAANAASRATTSFDGAFRYEPEIRGMDGLETTDGRLLLVLPRTAAELRQWSALLRNCAHAYVDLVDERRTTLVGVREGARLRYLFEWTRPGEVRQLVSIGNRAVPTHDAQAITEVLTQHGYLTRAAADRCLARNDGRLATQP